MNYIKYYILFILAGFYCSVEAQPKNDSVFSLATLSSFKLTSASTRKTTTLPGSTKQRIFVFLSPECPICQNYTSVLNKLNAEYEGNILLCGIIPGKTYDAITVSAFAKKYNINYPLLIDGSLELSRYLQASVTPEVVFLNSNNEMIYRGAIDNWFKSLGKARIKTTENYLLDAIAQNSKHNPAIIKRTKPVGCVINDY